MPTLGNECHQNLSFRNIFVHDETGGMLSDGPNVADFLRLDINEVQARCLLMMQRVGS